jgi:hypothetical protein
MVHLSTIIGGEDNQGVASLTRAIQGLDNLPNAIVQVTHRGGVKATFRILDVVVDRDPLHLLHERCVNGLERDIKEERLVAFLLDPLDGLLGDQIGGVPNLLDKLEIPMPGPSESWLRHLVTVVVHPDRARKRSIAVVEPIVIRSPFGEGSHVPFPC